MDRRNRNRKKLIFVDLIFSAAVLANTAQILYDYEYWQEAPKPFYIFLLVQVVLLILLVRIPMSKYSNKCVERTMVFVVLSLLINTVFGTVWLVYFNAEHEDFLKTGYYVESIILLSIPISIAAFFVIVFVVVIIILLFEHRRNRFIQRFEDEGAQDEEEIEEIVETYMKMLEEIMYESDKSKQNDCAICLKEFEEKEKVHMIPNCSHIFHEQCLRKWFLQLQICPMCRGNIIKMPNNSLRDNSINQHQQQMVLQLANQQQQQQQDIIQVEVQLNQIEQQNEEMRAAEESEGNSQIRQNLESSSNAQRSSGSRVNIENQRSFYEEEKEEPKNHFEEGEDLNV